jgi:DNA-directed RNA polymerase specialized sigma24 family protein
MRWIVIDFVRQRRAYKRGGELTFVSVEDAALAGPEAVSELERLNEALGDLTRLQPDLAELVDLKYFCGFSFAEIAALRGVSERTAQRDWEKARLVLHDYLTET